MMGGINSLIFDGAKLQHYIELCTFQYWGIVWNSYSQFLITYFINLILHVADVVCATNVYVPWGKQEISACGLVPDVIILP